MNMNLKNYNKKLKKVGTILISSKESFFKKEDLTNIEKNLSRM